MLTEILAIGIPTLAVLVGILLNRNDANRLDARIIAFENSMRTELSSQVGSLRTELSAARTQMHEDVVMLMNIGREQDTRITRLEPH